jgi:hypothetical protein
MYSNHQNMLYFLRKFHRSAGLKLRCWLEALRTVVSLLLKHHKLKSAGYLMRGLVDGTTGRMGQIPK